jgi:hypothetical protein
VHVPYTELLNANGTPKPAAEIWKVLAKAGVPRYAGDRVRLGRSR